jgi:hypothetical protein
VSGRPPNSGDSVRRRTGKFEPGCAFRAFLAGSARMRAYPRIPPHILAMTPSTVDRESAANRSLLRPNGLHRGAYCHAEGRGFESLQPLSIAEPNAPPEGRRFSFGSTPGSTGCSQPAIRGRPACLAGGHGNLGIRPRNRPSDSGSPDAELRVRHGGSARLATEPNWISRATPGANAMQRVGIGLDRSRSIDRSS